ncbi:MAG: aminotransferase class I/II-fold pyridoxal phosphate-dependent enzyme [Lachnospiraceae bacterium]|nr:aminotransferase class I/II-fold pyridoxal phosphate-dependent enzyme [Lachnospiraceae bacterium]
MIKPKDHFHGSDLEKIEQIYGIKKEDIISFSANVNPLGISPKLKASLSNHIDAITTYPDREYTSLRKCIADYIDSDYNNIIVGNGSTELISLFIQIKAPKKALIIGPTYSEYEREVILGNGIAHYYPLNEEEDFSLDLEQLKEDLRNDVDLLIICNPNNPTSTAINCSVMRKILDVCKRRGIFVMVDETYVEFADNPKEIECVPLTHIYNNIIILRGVSKFFAAPGLRLGYAICGNQDLIKEINKRKNPWTINTLASIAGEIMFTDTDYIRQTKDLIFSERQRIYNELSAISTLKPYKPVANFILVKILKGDFTADMLFDKAIRKGLMIRDCSTFPFLDSHYFRFCFMSPENNTALLDLIRKELS